MPNWGAEIPVTIVDRKPDFVGDDDLCAIYQSKTWLDHNRASRWGWHSGITAIKLLADHPYYAKERTMIISREAAIEALKRLGIPNGPNRVAEILANRDPSSYQLAKAIQRLWDLCPSERPVDNRVIAMRHAWLSDVTATPAVSDSVKKGEQDERIKRTKGVRHD